MIASCPQCAMSLTFDDSRLPTEPFNILCPRCRQAITHGCASARGRGVLVSGERNAVQAVAPRRPGRARYNLVRASGRRRRRDSGPCPHPGRPR